MAYLNRNNFGKFWPIPRKGTTYVAVASHNRKEAMPLIIVMRDVLKLVKNNKELKKLINERQIKINGKDIKEVNYPVSLFDVLGLDGLKKNYKMVLLKNKKYSFEEVSGKETSSRPYKVMDKKILSNKEVQLNLMYGKNLIYNDKANVGDSIILDFEDKVIKIVQIKKGENAMVLEGKHAGNSGKIEEVIERGGKKLVKIKSSDGEKINVWIKNIIAVE